MTGPGGAGAWRALAAGVALLALATAAPARADAPCTAGAGAATPETPWPAPLDRTVTFHARGLSLRDALDRLAAAARIRLTYSADLLPLDRRVCASHRSVAVGAVLAQLLRDAPVEPVVAGADHVVLAPRPARRGEPPPVASVVVALERIVVTGSASGGPRRELPIALDVVGRAQLARAGTAPLTRLLNRAAAGPWAWEQPPSSLMARYGSIRGASSFGVSYPKVFVDGIEVANPLLATQIAPEAVERIEVIRGPQGAALYGTDAISGVINIVTRQQGTETGAPRAHVRGGVGAAASDYAPGGVLTQDHAVALRTGSSQRSAGVNVAYATSGEFVPGRASTHFLAGGSARRVGARSLATATGRLSVARAGVSVNPLLRRALGPRVDSVFSGVDGQRMHQYTLGGRFTYLPGARWTHVVVAGVDGNRLSGVPDELTPVPSAAEAALRTSEGAADRLTLRASSVARLGSPGRAEVALTLAAEHSALRERPAADSAAARDPPATWAQSSGVVTQANVSLHDRLHLTAGVRAERNESFAGRSRHAVLPALGATWVQEWGDATLKLRAAYGRGIRPARTPPRRAALAGSHALLGQADLEPEEQEGFEAGFDLALGGRGSLQVTAYDQLASGLIQRVALPADTSGGRRRTRYMLQNVGEVSNRGWEVQAAAEAGPLALAGALALVDSRVRGLARGYGGDLRPGDRMLEVPARTASLTAAWTGGRGSASVTAYRAWDWIGYDRLLLARDFAAGNRPPHEFAGDRLRAYWRGYDGVTRLNATATIEVRRWAVLVLTGDNLLDEQRGEPDNLTLVPGRTLTLGLRAEL